MGTEISVSAVLVEMDGGVYRASCPELDMEAEGESSEEAFENLKSAAQRLVREAGAEGLSMRQVKCLRFKLSID